ncbi:hypothetical protein BpHYR1_017353 [Brachionus plicatilis]|uniref:Uncharacterized protein n=1 Tax=Brachionus plicatilis TaxID=10195 RepID=A0A3M7QVA7_BRAPC|nr:hypothetical protein BpHYR1_017353 [Brachionus plicatilis]
MKSKFIIFRSVPKELNIDELKWYLASEAFEFKSVVSIVEFPTIYDLDKTKDVLVEFDSHESAEFVADKKSFIYQSKSKRFELKPLIYYKGH